MTKDQFRAQLNFEINFIPQGKKNRPGTLISPVFVTIHNTGNTTAGADAIMHGKFLTNSGFYMLNGKKHFVSWHYTVDDKRVVKHLPFNEKAFHAVDGNSVSIGIEVCMHQGIDQAKAFLNAARLTALLLFEVKALKKDISKVVPHKHWTGKNCPALLLDGGNTIGQKWQGFLDLIQKELNTITDIPKDIPEIEQDDTSPMSDKDLKAMQEAARSHFEENGIEE